MPRIQFLFTFIFILAFGAIAQVNYKNIHTEDKYPVQILESDNEVIFNKAPTLRYDRIRKKLYVVNSGDYNILIFDEDLKYIGSFGRKGQGPCEFEYLQGMDISRSGNLVVVEWIRIQVLDESYHYLSGFPVNLPGFGAWRIGVDNSDRIYINDAKSDSLFYICDFEGNQLGKFGSIFPYTYQNAIRSENQVLFEIDENDNLFCAFVNYPILRKYNHEQNLVYEINVAKLPEVKWKKESWEKRSANRLSPNLYIGKIYFLGLCVDEHYIFLSCDSGPGPLNIYVFDKIDGCIVKKMVLYTPDKDEMTFMHSLECDDQYLYTIDGFNMRILRYEK